jgi:hypothetical protein
LHSYAMPTNATRCEKWWRRGAWEDFHRVEFAPALHPRSFAPPESN